MIREGVVAAVPAASRGEGDIVMVRLDLPDGAEACVCGRSGGCAALAGVARAMRTGPELVSGRACGLDVGQVLTVGDRVRLECNPPPDAAWVALAKLLGPSAAAGLAGALLAEHALVGPMAMSVGGVRDLAIAVTALVFGAIALRWLSRHERGSRQPDMVDCGGIPPVDGMPRVCAVGTGGRVPDHEWPRVASVDAPAGSSGHGLDSRRDAAETRR